MDRKKLMIYGAVGLAVVGGGYFLLRSRSSQSADTASQSSSYYPPTVIGSGATSADTSGTSTNSAASSTDTMISQLLASQLQSTQLEYDYKNKALDSNQTLTLATLQNSTDLANINANASIEASLASQLGTIIGGMSGSRGSNAKFAGGTGNLMEVAGGIGYHNGVISLDIAGQSEDLWGPVGATTGGQNVKDVKSSPILSGLGTIVTPAIPRMPAVGVPAPT